MSEHHSEEEMAVKAIIKPQHQEEKPKVQAQSPPKKAAAPVQHGSEEIQGHIVQLEQHMAECIREGLFQDAEDSKHKIAELKIKNWEQQKVEMDLRHTHQYEECDQAHQVQYQEFNETWDHQLNEQQQ